MIQFKLISEKQKRHNAATQVIKSLGAAFYSLPLEERDRLKEEKYQELYAAPINLVHKISLPIHAEVSDTHFPQVSDKALAPADSHVPELQEVKKHETFSLLIELNEKQQLAADFANAGKSFVMTGAAGTGKTTAAREIAKGLLFSGRLGTHTFRIKGSGERVNAPSVAFVAYTNRAAANLARSILKDPELQELSPCITTIHNLLEYAPIFYQVPDEENGGMKETMRFEPQRHASNPLDITHLVIEESSQVGALDLYPKLLDACRSGVQIIFMGDINQLQPIFSPSILNYALVNLPVVELTEVYRQALDSPIISNAHKCLRGEQLEQVLPHFKIVSGKNIHKIPSESVCANLMINSFKKWIDQKDPDTGEPIYDPEQDIVLCPFNKHSCGTIEVNYKIAQFLGQRRNAMVYEIIAGIRKLYLAPGDKVMYMKQDGVIERISHNAQYLGKMPIPASTDLNRFGMRLVNFEGTGTDEDFELTGYENLNVNEIPDEDEKRKNQASHVVHIKLETGGEVALQTAGDFSEANFSLGYALTVHKAQGCEWRKVFILLHRSHAVLLNRELIYTAITRAREYCTIIDLCNVTDRAIKAQKVKGNTIEEKIEYFNSEVSLKEPVNLIP